MLKCPREVLLAGKVRAVSDPDRESHRPKLLADRDALEIVRDRLRAHRRISMSQATVLVRVGLPGLILEGIGINGGKAQAERLGVPAQRSNIIHAVPRDVR